MSFSERHRKKAPKQGKQQHTPSQVIQLIKARFGNLSRTKERVRGQKTNGTVADNVGEAGDAVLDKDN